MRGSCGGDDTDRPRDGGGIGNPPRSIIGALTLRGLQNGLALMNVPSFWHYVASVAVVILPVYVDRLARPSR